MTETIHDIPLPGCTPEPLMSYLKALGILRLVSEQKDTEARSWWQNDVFWLRSPVLFKDITTVEGRKEAHNAIGSFFLQEYRPTPIVAPWNGGSGFFLKWDEKKSAFKKRDATDALLKIESSKSKRLQRYREQIRAVKEVLEHSAKPVDPAGQINNVRDRGRRERWSEKKTKDEVKKLLDSQMLFAGTNGETLCIEKADKDAFVREARSDLLYDEAVQWIDTAFVVRIGQKKNRVEAPLLGSGGNIGNSDFSARFMRILSTCIPLTDGEAATPESEGLLRSAIFGGPTAGLAGLAADQFYPGRAGGANMFQGMEAGFRLNPWDYLLMLEGVILLRGAASKRFASGAPGSAFPFAVESTMAGFVSAGSDTTRGEQWLPLWERACTSGEIATLLAEGRSEIGNRRAKTAVEFARAAATLGVDRGIKQFVRIQYQARFGDNYLANALGRVEVLPRDSIDLVREVDPWLDRFRSATTADKNAPIRFVAAIHSIDSAIFDFCRYGGKPFYQRILVALGHAERELALTEGKVGNSKIKPLVDLSQDWIDAANDNSPEFGVALALSQLLDTDYKIGPLRANLEPVDWRRRCRTWAEKNRSVVWNPADLATNLADVLQRRMMDSQRNSCEHLPLASHFAASLETVATFIEGELDERRIEDLIWGLMLIDGSNGNPLRSSAIRASNIHLPREYALLKLLFLPQPLVAYRKGDRIIWRLAPEGESGILIRPEPRIPSLVRTGRVGEACQIAAQRLRVSGLSPMPGPVHGKVCDDQWVKEWRNREVDYRHAQHLAAALLIPVGSREINELVRLVCRDTSIAAGAS
jgi:CRISPR-associated protein Csx17